MTPKAFLEPSHVFGRLKKWHHNHGNIYMTSCYAALCWSSLIIISLLYHSFPNVCPLSQTSICSDYKLLSAMVSCLTLTLTQRWRFPNILPMPQSTPRGTDAFIEECKVQASSLTTQDFNRDFPHTVVESELIIERRPSTEINSHSDRRREGQLASASAINIYLKTHKCFKDLLQSLPDKSRLVVCKSRWCFRV